MSERANLPPNYDTVFDDLVEFNEIDYSFDDPETAELVDDAEKTAVQMANALSKRLEELDLDPLDQTFHDMPLTDGSIRVAITPPGSVFDETNGSAWRIIINEGHSDYEGEKQKELWDIMDILVDPGTLRLGVNHAKLRYAVGYGDSGVHPNGVPPRIFRDTNTYTYSISNAKGYSATLPEVPVGTTGERLKYYQNFSNTVGTALEVFGSLSEVTRAEAATNLEQNEGY
jgi:hypothetical protein